ncbi:MAG: amino acid racemase [Candidatus Aminicenantes bacterium]|nr:MAG: amino acid racemase [Candidatus Aminicenantes bacterium]
MSRKKLKTIGILGGMGPEAGSYFFEKIVRETVAGRDQDHPPVVLYCLPQVPDRTMAILHGGPSPVPALRRGLRALSRAGADFAVISCISAHYFYPRIAPDSPVPLISLIDETLAVIGKMRPVPKTIGLLATTGTVRSALITQAFGAAGIAVITPSARNQKRVMTAIYGRKGIKAGSTEGPPRTILLEIAAGLVSRGAQAILAGCTEVPLVVRAADLPVPLIEPMIIGARAAIRRAGATPRP